MRRSSAMALHGGVTLNPRLSTRSAAMCAFAFLG
jgi:hypothetical protein